jgi:TonB family protein
MAAAVAAHAAVIAWLVARPAPAVVREESTAVSVALVAPPPGLASPAEPAQPNESTTPADVGADQPEKPGEPPASDPTSPAEPAQPDQSTAPAAAGADHPKKRSKPRPHSDASAAKPPPPKPKQDHSAGVYSSEGAQELPEGTAAYQVVVGTGGVIRSIVLMRSSGVASYDAAGVAMIRNAMTFDPPARSSATAARTVTISFSPEH